MNIVIMAGILITLVTGIPVILQMVRNHPRGLIILFFAEMWERFSYYGMRAILIFYLTQHFLFDDAFASHQYGAYTSLVYLLPLLGGLIADRYLGTRKAIAFGALLLVAGHLTMAYEGRPATQTLTYAGQTYEMRQTGRADSQQAHIVVAGKPYAFGAGADEALAIKDLPAGSPLPSVLAKGSYVMKEARDPMGVGVFYLALALIITGVGFLKANISTIVGQLYPEKDPRRDSGFTLYYYGINLGAFWAAILCGYLGQNFGWSWGFGLAGVGMAAGYLVFTFGKPLLQGKGEPPNPAHLAQPVLGPINREWLIYILGFVGVAGVYFFVQRPTWVSWGLIAATIASVAFVAWVIVRVCKTTVERQRMMLAMVLIFGAVVFWTLFEQGGSSLNLFANRNVDLALTSAPSSFSFLGMDWLFASTAQIAAAGLDTAGKIWIDTTLTASQTQSFNSAYILIFAPMFAALWTYLGKRNRDPNPTLKFGLGLLQVGLGFMVVVWGAGLHDSSFRVPLVLLGLLYLLHTTGELCLSPVGLSQITKLSIPMVASFMMAMWFLSSSIASNIGGTIAALAGTETVGGQVLDPSKALATSLGIFEKLGWAGIAFGVLYLALSVFIKHWAHPEAPAREEAATEA
jgi:POT family proton-dependent oligopeptide transporter